MDNPGGHKQLPWLGMANIAPIKMAMECGLFVALGFPHYSCGKIGFVWIIHHHSTDVVLSYSSRKSTINHEYTWVSMYKHIKYIYIYTVISTRCFTGFQDLKRFFCDHLPFQEQQSCTKLKWENNGKHGMFFQFTETLVKTGWIALRMDILWPCKAVGHV